MKIFNKMMAFLSRTISKPHPVTCKIEFRMESAECEGTGQREKRNKDNFAYSMKTNHSLGSCSYALLSSKRLHGEAFETKLIFQNRIEINFLTIKKAQISTVMETVSIQDSRNQHRIFSEKPSKHKHLKQYQWRN